MKLPLSWITEHVDVGDRSAADIGTLLTARGLKVESVEPVGDDLAHLVVGRVLEIEELTGFNKPIRFCQLDDGTGTPRSVICGAQNFAVGDRVVLALPGARLPGGFEITSSKRYGHVSDGMMCSARELGLGDDHDGIMILDGEVAVGSDAIAALGLRDSIIDIEVTSDRGYCLSVRGIARELAGALGQPFADPARIDTAPAATEGIEVSIDDPAGCDRYVALHIDGVDPLAPSPLSWRRKLLAAGMRPISLAVDVTNLVLLELGQPLHAFDADTLTGVICVRRANVGESLTTLDGVERTLDADDLVIADDSGAIALAGVMGGARTEIGAATTRIVLEAAHFAPTAIARTARRHRLTSEASRRFERGVDHDVAAAAAQLAAELIVAHAGGVIGARTEVDLRAPGSPVVMDVALPGEVVGREYEAEQVIAHLVDVGCDVSADGQALMVQPPSWRPDLTKPIDLVEEVARLGGYDTIPATLPPGRSGGGLTAAQRGRRAIADILAAAGMVETPTYPFVAADAHEQLGIAADDVRAPSVRLVNPLSEREPMMRAHLLPTLLAALVRNISRGAHDVALFDIASVFRQAGGGSAPRLAGGHLPSPEELAALDAALPEQPLLLAGVLAGDREPAGWWGGGRPAMWADAIELVRLAAQAIDVELDVASAEMAPWHPGRCAALSAAGVVLGHAGELHPRVVDALDLPPRTVAFELDVDQLLACSPARVIARPLSAFPAATIDVALVVANEVPADSVRRALIAGGGQLLESVRLFDVYTGAPVPAGSRSLAFTLTVRAADRTLTADEAVAVRDAAVAAANDATGAQLRS